VADRKTKYKKNLKTGGKSDAERCKKCIAHIQV
jgi:hypothetical protein